MTNDRRKTFNTLRDFMMWALEHPSKRRAKTKFGIQLRAEVVPMHGSVYLMSGLEKFPLLCDELPLTAVEDEHGVIEEDLDTCDLRAVELHLECLIDPKEEFRKSFHSHCIAGQLTRFIQQEATRIADERIAAATVMQETANGLAERVKNYRLKPKGDA